MAPTEPKRYAIELGQHECHKILKQLRNTLDKDRQPIIKQDPDTACELYQGKLTHDGHWQIQRAPRIQTRASQRSSSNQHRAYYVHRIAYVALHGVDVEHTASHLCGHGNCVNPFHIHDEPIDLNVARINCLGYVDCQEHNHRLATLCQHQPPCIKRPIFADSCCLSLSLQQPALPSYESQDSQAAQPTTFDDFLAQDLPPSDPPWLESSQELFDVNWETASDDASPLPESSGPTPSPPPWKDEDFASESQQTTESSDYIP
jgi:hypothetical protein